MGAEEGLIFSTVLSFNNVGGGTFEQVMERLAQAASTPITQVRVGGLNTPGGQTQLPTAVGVGEGRHRVAMPAACREHAAFLTRMRGVSQAQLDAELLDLQHGWFKVLVQHMPLHLSKVRKGPGRGERTIWAYGRCKESRGGADEGGWQGPGQGVPSEQMEPGSGCSKGQTMGEPARHCAGP